MVCLKVGVNSNYTIQGNRFASMNFLQFLFHFLLPFFQCSKHPNQSHTNNKEFVISSCCCCLMFFSIIQFLVSLCCFMSLYFHFHPQGSPYFFFLYFFAFDCFVFLALGVLLQLLFRKYFIYKQIQGKKSTQIN